MSYYWIEGQLHRLDRKRSFVAITEYCWRRTRKRLVRDVDVVLRTVRIGSIIPWKSTHPNRICFARYEGKSNTTYEVIAEFKKYDIEVVTVWKRKGR